MMTLNAVGATWTVLMFVVMGAICIKYGDDPVEMPAFSSLSFWRKTAAFLCSVLFAVRCCSKRLYLDGDDYERIPQREMAEAAHLQTRRRLCSRLSDHKTHGENAGGKTCNLTHSHSWRR